MKLLAILAFAAGALAAELPLLPASNTITTATVTCIMTVIDVDLTLQVRCENLTRVELESKQAPNGKPFGAGDVLCLYQPVEPNQARLQCAAGGAHLPVLDGRLAPVNRKRTWR